MNKNVDESIAFVNELHQKLTPISFKNPVEVLVFPPFTSLYSVKNLSNIIKIGAQNLHFEDKGAFTGEISPLMLKNLVQYVLIGHSERREIFKESDDSINKKLKTALKYNFSPILCIGETLHERETGKTFSKIESQLLNGLKDLSINDIKQITIAYEPIWAIGTGKNATPDQADEIHAFIKKILLEKFFQEKNFSGKDIPLILYGGSVTAENSAEILAKNNINGVLVGGASLHSESFFGIIMNSQIQTLSQ